MTDFQLAPMTGDFKDKPVDTTKIQIAIGIDDFKEILSTSDVFVDKTPFIKNIIDSTESSFVCATEPKIYTFIWTDPNQLLYFL